MALRVALFFFLAVGEWLPLVGGEGSQDRNRKHFQFKDNPDWFLNNGAHPWKPQTDQQPKNPPSKKPEKGARRRRGRQVSEELQQEIRGGWVPGASRILTSSDDVEALAQGLRFPANERSELLKKTKDRTRDGDVVAFKAIANAALMEPNERKLARVLIRATTQPGLGHWFSHKEQSLEDELIVILSDRGLMSDIVSADPAKQFVPPDGVRRKLTCDGCSPADSWVCAHCWPSIPCSPFFWCPSTT